MDIKTFEKSDKIVTDFDSILLEVGEFGLYQKLLLWFICLPACIPCGFCAFNQLFMATTPNHWCKVGELSNFTQQEQRNISIPFIKNDFAKCIRYVTNWTDLLLTSEGSLNNIFINKSWSTEGCKDGWVYEISNTSSSIVVDFNLVCERDLYPTLGLVALNLGGPIGVYFFGMINDRVGRRKSFFLCLTTLLFGSLLTCTAQNFWWWAGSRVIVGLTIPAIYQIPFIISLELVGPNYRSFVTVMTCLFYALGLIMLSGVTYLIRNWVYLGIATSLPFILYYIYWFFLPESPRWLLSKRRYEEAFKIIEILAKINGKRLLHNYIDQQEAQIKIQAEKNHIRINYSYGDLCKTPNMRLKTILITLNWFANETVYVGLSYYSPSLGSNEYMSFLLSVVVEIPSYLFCWLIMDKWGRRWPLSICMVISGVCCIATVLLPNGYTQTTFVLFLISKSTISASFLIIYPFAGEIYPTEIRGLGIGMSAYIGGLGLIIIPFITYLGTEMLILPLAIMGLLAIIGGLSALRLPETMNSHLPRTMEEGEAFGNDGCVVDCLRCVTKNTINEGYVPEDRATHNQYLGLISLQTDSNNISREKLFRRQSVMHTETSSDGTMQVTYWF